MVEGNGGKIAPDKGARIPITAIPPEESSAYEAMLLELLDRLDWKMSNQALDYAKQPETLNRCRSFFQTLKKGWDEKFTDQMPTTFRSVQAEPQKLLLGDFPATKPPLESTTTSLQTIPVAASQPAKAPNAAPSSKSAAPEMKSTGVRLCDFPTIPPQPHAKVAEQVFTFHLPNGRVGQPYSDVIVSEPELKFGVTEIKFPEAWEGFSFDCKKRLVTGTPPQAGEFRLSFMYRTERNERRSGSCIFVVTPDPQSLWLNLPQDANQLYGNKLPDACSMLEAKDGRIVVASRRGRSHAHIGSYRDDDFFISLLDSGWSLLVVADGAGSARFSREGSRLAVETTGKLLSGAFATMEAATTLAAYMEDWEHQTEAFHAWFHAQFYAAAKASFQAIEAEAERQQATPKDYATTLLAAVVKRVGTQVFLATLWVGDGAIAAYGEKTPGVVKLMGVPDSGEFAGQTRFLDRAVLLEGFAKRVSIGCFPNISHVLLMTDGISDPFFETDNGLKNAKKWTDLIDAISPLLEKADAGQQLLDWMAFQSPGHHDDRTLVVQCFGTAK